MIPKNELIPIVDAAFDDARFKLRCKNDQELAEQLGTSVKTISEIRNGRWTVIDSALITVLVSALRNTEGSEEHTNLIPTT